MSIQKFKDRHEADEPQYFLWLRLTNHFNSLVDVCLLLLLTCTSLHTNYTMTVNCNNVHVKCQFTITFTWFIRLGKFVLKPKVRC